ncbi:MAG: PorP/SprF family type IX secretion system membrane protein [Bacteroidia bacterium]
MKNVFTYLLLISCCITGWRAHAQDPHYTQAHRIPSWYNPAAAGHGVEHIRLTMLYRNQWSSVMSPFKTQGLFFDKQVSKVGLGANLVNNSSGDAGIRQLFLNGQISYRFTFGKSVIASGLQVGLIQKSFDPSKMTFDDQYTPDQGANPTNPTSETFSYTKLTRPDFGGGMLWTYGHPGKEKFYPYAGISLQHINQPKESFIEENNFIPRKVTANAGVGIVLSEAVTLTPMLLFAQQQFSKELLGGVMVKLPLEGRDNVEGGLMFRSKDAAALYAGYQWNNFMLGMSYDVNISGVTGGPGAFELTLTYIPKAKEKKELAKKKQKEKEKDKEMEKKKSTPKANSTTTKPKSSVPTSGPKSTVATNTPAPKTQEKTAPAKTPNSSDVKSAVTTKPLLTKPAAKTEVTVKPPVSTVPANTTPQAKNASAKVDTPNEKLEITKAVLKKTKTLPIPSIALTPKKSTSQTKLVNNLPLESHELPEVVKATSKAAPKRIDVTVPVQHPKAGDKKSISSLPIEERERAFISPMKLKAAPTSVPVLLSPLQVNKTKVKGSLGIPANNELDITSINTMPKKAVVLPSVVVKKPEIRSAPKVKSVGIPVESPEVLVNIPTTITHESNVISSVNAMPKKSVVLPSVVVKKTEVKTTPKVKSIGIPVESPEVLVNIPTTITPIPMVTSSVSDSTIESSSNFGIIEFKPFSANVHGIYKLDVIEPAFDSVYWDADLFIVITGHTKGEGNTQSSMNLSQARADAVRAIFLKKGLPAEKIQTVAYGETKPLENNSTEEEKQHNRRVEIHVIRKKHP